jgi:hypothetical protein
MEPQKVMGGVLLAIDEGEHEARKLRETGYPRNTPWYFCGPRLNNR